LLDFKLDNLHLYSNTLQAIAAGYLVAGVVLVNLPGWIHLPVTAGLLAGYWALVTYVPVPGSGPGMFQEQVNLGRYVDDLVLGSFRDGSTYAWIVGSLNFAATVMLGLHAGQILRWRWSGWAKTACLVLAGAVCLGAGWAWSYRLPLNKHLFSSSMVLWAAGWSYLLLAGFYLVIDVLGWRRWAFPLVVIGANAIFAYMVTHVFSFSDLANKLVSGFAQMVDRYVLPWTNQAVALGPTLRAFSAVLLLWLVLYYMYRNKTFVRV
jgi:predicted acyltransferase